VSALILCGTFCSGAAVLPSLPLIEQMLGEWGHGFGLKLFAPSLTGEQQMRRFGIFERAVGSPAMARSRIEMIREIDVTPVLDTLRVPTLVLHRSEDHAVSRDAAEEMAAAIAGARYVELPGDEHIPWVGDAEEVLSAIEEFLTGARTSQSNSVLATVLFTDIVDSTARSSEIGDNRWRTVVDAHDAIVRERIAGYRGREVKTMGDGFLATFDGPARGIHCARSIIQDVADVGVQVRAGMHTGECQLVGDDVSGIAVSIGARVSSLAAGGEVLVSRTVKDLVVGSGIAFEPRGTHELKGVPGSWELFAATG
jgi:class 3 adenylate cyclase